MKKTLIAFSLFFVALLWVGFSGNYNSALLYLHSASGATAVNLSVSGSAVSFTSGNVGSFPYARVQVQNNAVYVTYDGTTPSSSNGEQVAANTTGYFLAKDVVNMKFVSQTGTANVFMQPCLYVNPNDAANN